MPYLIWQAVRSNCFKEFESSAPGSQISPWPADDSALIRAPTAGAIYL